MSDDTYQTLVDTLVREAGAVFSEIIAQHSDVYVLGLYHMGGFDAVFPLFNTQAHVPPRPDWDSTEQMIAYCDARWAPSSYPMLEEYTDRLPESCAILAQLGRSDDDAAMWDTAINSMVMAMKILAHGPDFIAQTIPLTFYVATYDEAWQDRIQRVKTINRPPHAATILPDFEWMASIQAAWWQDAIDSQIE